MFRNMEKDVEYNQYDDLEFEKGNLKLLFGKVLGKENILLYIISFLISMVNFKLDSDISLSVFGIALIAACMSNQIPIGIIYIINGIGTFISSGTDGVVTYLFASLVLLASVYIVRPKIKEDRNEKRRIGLHLFFSSLIVSIIPMFFGTFLLYDLLISIMISISICIFYKIFSNSITVIKDYKRKKVFSIEEVIGASLLISIAILTFEPIQIYGFSVKNILSIVVVLVLGWKHGILLGGTAGITTGIVLGIISNGEPIMVASYAIAGMLAGLFNKFGKIGVIIGFIVGNVLLTYVANGNVVPIILFKEILIASIALLAIPDEVGINIEDLFGKNKLLPVSTGKNLEENKETVFKLNSISETISEMAKNYKEAAATVVDDEEIKEKEEYNKKIFINELKNSLDGLEDNLLYDDIYENEIQTDIYNYLLENEIMDKNGLLNIMALHNNYIVNSDNAGTLEKDINKIIKAINYSYRISNLNFIWKKKIEENKKNVSTQLEGVSEVISNLADEIINKKEEKFEEEKEKLNLLLKQKNIQTKNINITKEKTGRFIVTLYTETCENVDNEECDIKKLAQIISKVLGDNFILQEQECGLRLNKDNCMFKYISRDKFRLQVGVSTAKKKGSPISGDTSTQTKLSDGKYLLAISDGMGSGPEARKSSKIAIKMLERLLKSGFEEDTSIKLINSTLSANTEEDMYATLDVQILDLYAGTAEFIKNGACPTYIKRGNEVQILKSESLPAGILNDVDLEVYNTNLEDDDILVMCSDGVIDSNTEYLNKELWIKYLLEDIETDDVQQIADIIINESIDNDYGKEKDDMTVIVAKVKNRK